MRELTDSYCERCGTRYTFGPGHAKGPSLTGARLLARGLKNFVLTDGTSMDEAMAAARIDVTKDESSRVTEEFHRTFNFCMTCRQYACDKCWNENQGACLSCAPLWDVEPVAPRDHLIIRTPVFHQGLEGLGTPRSPMDVAPWMAGAPYDEPWPAEDPLPPRPAALPGGNGHRAPEMTPMPAAQATPLPLATPPPQAPMRAPAQQPRPPARVSEEERSAAEQLHAQSQAWKSQDDGWSLWPLNGEPTGSEMTLTPEELQLVEAQLSHAPSHDEPEASPTRAAPDAAAFTPSHTLDEDAAHVAELEPSFRTEPERPVPDAREPETPAPRATPSSDFDLLGSLRQPIESAQPPADSEPRRAPVIGRLLGHHRTSAAETPPAAAPRPPKTPRPVKAPRQKGTGPTTPWPVATRWTDRPIEPHDWWADADSASSDAEPPIGAMAAQTQEPLAAVTDVENPMPPASAPLDSDAPARELEPEPEPIRAGEVAPEPSVPDQQPLFTLPPATIDRWAPTKPDLPAVPVEWPASDPVGEESGRKPRPAPRAPLDPATVAAQHFDEPAPWPPIGASWPTQTRSAAPWPVPQNDLVPASVVAASRAEHAETAESPLVAALWAESAQQVLDRGSVRVCHHCSLPVSTQARYCRRCGTQQG
ncbi:MAG: hypothetical protein ABSD62_11475 [Candidatus Limnocylindrales bacterium]|jgi:ribosomal protein L40E